MSYLLDVSLLAACAWQSHARHREAGAWLAAQKAFATCPVTQMGFMRVSMSPAFLASFADARKVLSALTSLPAHRFVVDASEVATLPELTSRHHITDAHLLALALQHGLKFATLDDALVRTP